MMVYSNSPHAYTKDSTGRTEVCSSDYTCLDDNDCREAGVCVGGVCVEERCVSISSLKEPERMCPLIDEMQSDLAILHEHYAGIFPEKSVGWDIIMGQLLMLDVLRSKIETLRAWGKEERKNHGLPY